MVAYFPELHDQVHQVLHLVFVCCQVEEISNFYLVLDPVVQNFLSVSHDALDDGFFLWSYLLLDIDLEPSQHEWLKDQMKSLELMLVQLSLIHGVLFNIFGKPFLELLMIIKQLWHDEMKKCPKLSHRVLNRCSRQQKPISCVEVKQCLPSSTLIVFNGLSFIKDHVMPFYSLKS